jgi:regulator of protease activity HflC (stomatin/prohibitin superfamily)
MKVRNALSALRLFGLLLAMVLISKLFVVVPAGERGVLLRFGAVQERILPEGLHPLVPVLYSVEPLSVRLQSLEMNAEAASRDLQDVSTDVAVSWHIREDKVNQVFERVGTLEAAAHKVIEPAIEEVLKAVMAAYTAEQIVTEREAVKRAVDLNLSDRLDGYELEVDDVSLVHVRFSERFRNAVEAKQVAEQEAKRAEFETMKAQRLAEARVYQARGEAQAQQLLQTGLTPEVLERQVIEKWNGQLPLVMGGDTLRSLDFKSLLKANTQQRRKSRERGAM